MTSTHRKLPEIPNRLSHSISTENLLVSEASHDVELSLPVSLAQQPVNGQVRKPRRTLQIESTPNAQALTHYNRVSFKRKSRGSYVKAVTGSQVVNGPTADSVEQTDGDNTALTEHQNIMTALTERKEVGDC